MLMTTSDAVISASAFAACRCRRPVCRHAAGTRRVDRIRGNSCAPLDHDHGHRRCFITLAGSRGFDILVAATGSIRTCRRTNGNPTSGCCRDEVRLDDLCTHRASRALLAIASTDEQRLVSSKQRMVERNGPSGTAARCRNDYHAPLRHEPRRRTTQPHP